MLLHQSFNRTPQYVSRKEKQYDGRDKTHHNDKKPAHHSPNKGPSGQRRNCLRYKTNDKQKKDSSKKHRCPDPLRFNPCLDRPNQWPPTIASTAMRPRMTNEMTTRTMILIQRRWSCTVCLIESLIRLEWIKTIFYGGTLSMTAQSPGILI